VQATGPGIRQRKDRLASPEPLEAAASTGQAAVGDSSLAAASSSSSSDKSKTAELPGGTAAPQGAPALALLATVFLMGNLVVLVGSILPVWRYHRLDAFLEAGSHFLFVAVGFLVANVIASVNAARHPAQVFSPLPGALFALVAVLVFAFFGPPYPIAFQFCGAFGVGLALGSLNATLFQRLGAVGQLRSSAAFQLSLGFVLLGSIIAPLLVLPSVGSNHSTALVVLAIPPLLVATTARFRMHGAQPQPPPHPFRKALDDFKNPTAILLALILLFQLGAELSLLGWLPLFLIQRLGLSPGAGILGLSGFALALLAGRMAIQAIGERGRKQRYCFGGLLLAMFGCLMLSATNNLFGASFGVALAGLGFAPVYPAVMGLIAGRFPYFHPAIFNSIFSVGVCGGLLTPWLVGLSAHAWGIQSVMAFPIVCALVVMVLLMLLWLEAKLMGERR
jgi:hypothetical protein